MTVWRLLDEGPQEAAWNMAVDKALLLRFPSEGRPTLRLYAWERPTLSLGYFQPSADVDADACRARGIAIVRRPTGGRAVLHSGEVTYSLVAPLTLFPPGVAAAYRRISAALIAALATLGLQARLVRVHRAGRSAACFEAPALAELTVADKKVIGSAQTRTRAALLQHGSVPLRFDLENLAAALRLSPRERRLLRRRAAGLAELVPGLDASRLRAALVEGFARAFDARLRPGSLSPAERELAARLARETFADWTQPARRSQGAATAPTRGSA